MWRRSKLPKAASPHRAGLVFATMMQTGLTMKSYTKNDKEPW